ncbi:D-erythronate dehydrogenase [Cnuibacter sp. UC19_7]|uniref:D-erythronate dehydrogenase n=1 Tax=Cnuibacter sp. UC19_7 TaxID=3350166 RepID=UPI00366AA633
MRILITGGSGFLGTLLARRLLAAPVGVGGSAPAEVTELVLLDVVAPADDLARDPRVTAVVGSLDDARVLGGIGHASGQGEPDAVVHLAGVVSGAAEVDLDAGLRGNLDGLRALLDTARRWRTPPVLLFSSSLAVFGRDPALAPLGVIADDTLPTPQSSYGIQKLIGEHLVTDYTRRGLVRGRSVRLMTVAVRPGRPNAAASSFLSGIIREPLAGARAVCPVDPDMPVALSSPSTTLAGLLRALEVDDATWGSTTAMSLPALTTTPREMVAALERVGGPEAAALVGWIPDPAVEAIVGTWPSRFHTHRAAALGLAPVASFDAVIEEFLA